MKRADLKKLLIRIADDRNDYCHSDLCAREYRSECHKIVDWFYKEHGVRLTLTQAYSLWKAYSDDLSARWIVSPNGATIYHHFVVNKQ